MKTDVDLPCALDACHKLRGASPEVSKSALYKVSCFELGLTQRNHVSRADIQL